MNTRFMCDECGSQPCLCQIFECPVCEGDGRCWNNADPTSGQSCDCEPCKGTGEVHCQGPINGKCLVQEYGDGTVMCYCEAAWDRQQEDLAAGDGPPTMREQQLAAQRQREELRR